MRPMRMEDVWADTPPDVIDAAFVDGVTAYLEGIPAHWNPSRRPIPEGIAWSNGWHVAQHDRLLGLRHRRVALKRSRVDKVRDRYVQSDL